MYLPSLQKNIQELDRQISLLETECEHMETDKKNSSALSKANSKLFIKESSNKAYITGPSFSTSTYLNRLRVISPVTKVCPMNCAHFRTMSENLTKVNDEKVFANSHKDYSNSCKSLEKRGQSPDSLREESRMDFLSSRNGYSEKQKTNFTEREYKKICKKSMTLIKEVSESSEENDRLHATICDRTKYQEEKPKKPIWCELLHEPNFTERWDDKLKCLRTEISIPQNFQEQKFSTDEENDGGKRFSEAESKSLNGKRSTEDEKAVTPRRKIHNHRRPRSARTKKNSSDDIPLDVNFTKTLQDKEIQCILENDNREKTEFLISLNESIKDLIELVGENYQSHISKPYKTSEGREKNSDILNDMQSTLLKISKIKSMNTVHNPLNIFASLDETPLKLSEGEENILDRKKILLGIKKFCLELADEKTALTQELNVKNRTLANLKSKEKEYLSLISSLKFNLEKMKEEADEGAHAKKDLKIMKTKLQEETKVIEALKKSHEKMQELIENYALENDKLKAQVKLTKLESQKFNIILAGKEVEINKYRKEIQSFQRQITEQLSLLRSKATENEIERALETISNQTKKLQTEALSNISDLTCEKDLAENYLPTTETTSESFSTRTQPDNQNKDYPSSVDPLDVRPKKEGESEPATLNDEQKIEKNANVSCCATCNSIDLEPTSESERQLGLQRVLSSSKNLRSSINEMLEDIRRKNSENHWSHSPNSCNTSSQTTLITITSDDITEGSQNDRLT